MSFGISSAAQVFQCRMCVGLWRSTFQSVTFVWHIGTHQQMNPWCSTSLQHDLGQKWGMIFVTTRSDITSCQWLL